MGVLNFYLIKFITATQKTLVQVFLIKCKKVIRIRFQCTEVWKSACPFPDFLHLLPQQAESSLFWIVLKKNTINSNSKDRLSFAHFIISKLWSALCNSELLLLLTIFNTKLRQAAGALSSQPYLLA